MQSRRSQLTRRKVLAGLGTIGVAGAGAGLGTTAFYSDREVLEGWLEAGRVDNILDFRSTYEPWDRYELHDVAPEDRPPLVPTDDEREVYLLAEGPAFLDAEGNPLSDEFFASDVRTLDACSLADSTDLSIGLASEDFEILNAFGVDTVPDDLFLPGFVDGETGIFLELDDVKPKDLGALQFDIHVCGNPSLAFLSVAIDEFTNEAIADSQENQIIEAEQEAGEVFGANFVNAGFEIDGVTEKPGELRDFLYLVLLKNATGVLKPFDEVKAKVFDAVNGLNNEEDVLFAGSASGLVETLINAADGRIQLEPSGLSADVDAKGLCFDVDVHGYQLSWFLACGETDPAAEGFRDLLLFNSFTENVFQADVLGDGNLVDVQDNDMDGQMTLNDELRERGYYLGISAQTADEVTVDVNVTQTDDLRLGFNFDLEQCRANS
ncbi:hypothetical protein [Haloarchaeobius sp. HME9146]|uniref:hypothetical protein n=1 Tax=Haloarchaeobius sp. HME9146 TaxID=2978732 RepID=UPI0021C0DEA1|nr:hypothetical protein [Haloarchaeobius sp. HME9146]MCT9096540.1 hypothetical protein [Haloarchaeobius sp. HME9146]